MPLYKGTYTLEMTLDITAADIYAAEQELHAHVSLQAYPTKLISVIRTSPAADMTVACPACIADEAARAEMLQVTWAPTPQDLSAA